MVSRRTGRPFGLRYAVELAVGVVLVSLALRTWIVQGLVVPVTVVGGSMAATLVGPHRRIVCAACRHSFAVGLERLPAGGGAVCAHCGCRDNPVQVVGDRPGQHLLIDRTALWRAAPRRWQVVVFRSPQRASSYGVKRVVALPGESVRVHQGDVYVNGDLARKDLQQQRAVAQLVHRLAPGQAGGGPPRWRQDTNPPRWRIDAGGLHHRHVDTEGSWPAPVDWLRYHHLAGQVIRDDVAYNQSQSRPLSQVTDLMLGCLVAGSGPGQLRLAAADGGGQFEVRIPNHGGAICLLHGGRPVARVPIEPGLLCVERRLVLSLFDAQVLLAVDGTVRLKYAYDRADKKLSPSSEPLAIGARRLDVALRDLTVWRDIHYTHPPHGRWGLERAWRLGPDEMFVLGDNSPISDDSRTWSHGGGLPARLLVGTPVGID